MTNAADLLSGLRGRGVILAADGDRLRLYATKGTIPPELVEELRSRKMDVLALLREPARYSEPSGGSGSATTTSWECGSSGSSSKAAGSSLDPLTWDADTAALIHWFSTAELPTSPFQLRAGTFVADPQKFYASLRTDIAAGPAGIRAARGALAVDLRDLRLAVMEHCESRMP